MTEQTQIRAETETALRDFVRVAVSRLPEVKIQVPEWAAASQWERGADGHFRERPNSTPMLLLKEEWLRSLPGYDTCVEHLKSDSVVGPHLDRLVGTRTSASRLDTDTIMRSAIHAMLSEEPALVFTDERFDGYWRKLVGFFGAKRIASKMVAPLPGLVVRGFPLRLSNELVLDRLTDDEVTRCCQVGVLRPDSPRFPLINSKVAVGVRRTRFVPKLIRTGDEPGEPLDVGDEGSFGSRPVLHDGLVVDDVLSALRLFKHTRVQSTGHASWTDSPWLEANTSYQVLRQSPSFGQFELSESEVPQFLELWHLLETGYARFGFSVRRFNLAFAPRLLADQVVDLVIAAESLFLGDLDVRDRGELRFRFALRAAKFIEHPVYSQREVFRVMRRAYDARSAIVHGGSPTDTRLPDNRSADLPTFIHAVEELLRLGLRKGLSMKEDGKKLSQGEYWEALVFSKPDD